MVDIEKYAFDFPRTEENKELFASHIDWESEEKEGNLKEDNVLRRKKEEIQKC